MALIKVPAKVKIVIEMLGLNAFFDICPDLDSALTALKDGKGGQAPPAAAPKASAPPRAAKRPKPEPAPQAPAAAAAAAGPPPAAAAGFPLVVGCQGCSVQIEIPAAGNWKCPRCYALVSAKADGTHRFGRSDKPVPITLSLTASRDCGEGLVHLVTSVCTSAFNGPKLDALRIAVHEVAQVMQQSVYANNPNGVYHVCIERQRGRVQIRFADSGAQIEANRSHQFFPHSSSQLAEFECRPHPSGGNTIRMVQT
jgi:hypothetical protein